MASLKKRKKRKREEMERPDTMDYQEALKDPAWDNERKWADAIMASNRRLGIDHFKLDKLTKGAFQFQWCNSLTERRFLNTLERISNHWQEIWIIICYGSRSKISSAENNVTIQKFLN